MLQVIRILSLIGLWLSGLSLYEYLTVKSGIAGLSVCKIGQSFDCGAVAQSSWSVFLGLPLASWGIAYFFSLFLFGLLAIKSYLVSKQTTATVFLFTSLLASIFSVFLFGVSYFSIGKLCPLCIGMYLVNFLTLACSIKYAEPLGFAEAAISGINAYLKIPASLIGINTTLKNSNLVRLGTVVVIAVLFGTTVAEDYINDRMIAPQVVVNNALTTWNSQPVQKIEINTVNSLNGDFTRGSPDAPIKIIEFSDFQCPACRNFYVRLEPLIEQYKDKIYLVFKNYPLDNACNSSITMKFHEHACYAASVARCAGEQGKFWEMVDYISRLKVFDNEATLVSARDEIDKGSAILGIDEQAIKECIRSERALVKIKQDVDEGNKLEIEGTPAIWINGRRVRLTNSEDLRVLFDTIIAADK